VKLEAVNTYFAQLENMIRAISQPDLQAVLHILEAAYLQGHRIFIMGNGGSAATASHFALDLSKNTITEGAPRLKAISLTDHVPLITAWSNDTAYEHIFAEQLTNLIEPGDVAIGISASGNSPCAWHSSTKRKQWRCWAQPAARSRAWWMPISWLLGRTLSRRKTRT
jgi:D-sedoheptulose 7-phosphate isomerase